MQGKPEMTRVDTMQVDGVPADTPPDRGGRAIRLALVAGIMASVVMLLPSWSGGLKLPLQNLWHGDTRPEDMPFALLPLSQYEVVSVFVVLLLGGVVAGLVVRALRLPAWPAALGVLLVHSVAAAQSFIALGGGLGVGDGSAAGRELLYFGGMLGGTVAAVALAQLGCWMASRRRVGLPALAVALAAVPLADWISMVISSFTANRGFPPEIALAIQWVPAVIVGAALVWCGLRPWSRIVVWVVGLVGLWMLPAVFTAVRYGLGMRVLDGDIREMGAAAAQVFPLVLAETTAPVVIAALIGVAGTAVMWRRRSRPRSASGRGEA